MPDSTSGGYDTELGDDERFMELPKEKNSAPVFSTNMTERRHRRPDTAPVEGPMAERVGFEPTVPVRAQRFSRPSQSTTLAPLRRGICEQPRTVKSEGAGRRARASNAIHRVTQASGALSACAAQNSH